VNKNANPSLSKTGTVLLLLSVAAGCGSVSTQTSNDGGATGGHGGGGIGGRGGGGISGQGGGGAGGTGGTDGGNNALDASNLTAHTALPVGLATAGNYVILAETGISTVPAAVITGDLGISPYAAASITMFSLIADSTNVFSTSAQVTGKIYASNYATPTPANLTAAIGDMELAFTDAAGRAPDVTELGAGNIGGATLPAGVYRWGTGLLIPTDITLDGTATAVWIFQIAQTLTVSNATRVHLTGGALSKNVFWQVAGSVEIGTTAHIEGIILCKTMINMLTGSSIAGRLMAQSAVTLDSSTVVQPAP
jgi:Ice-binding-like